MCCPRGSFHYTKRACLEVFTHEDRDTKSGREQFVEDRALLMPIFTELMTVVLAVGDYPVEDEFLRAMRELNRIKKVSFSLVFAV